MVSEVQQVNWIEMGDRQDHHGIVNEENRSRLGQPMKFCQPNFKIILIR